MTGPCLGRFRCRGTPLTPLFSSTQHEIADREPCLDDKSGNLMWFNLTLAGPGVSAGGPILHSTCKDKLISDEEGDNGVFLLETSIPSFLFLRKWKELDPSYPADWNIK